jgi:hypothetical protein
MRSTRGEIGWRFLFAAVEWVGAVPGFFAAGLVDFGEADFGEEGFASGFDADAGEESCGTVAAGIGAASGADCFSGACAVAGAAGSCGVANAGEDMPPESAHTTANRKARQHLRPNRNTLVYRSREDANAQNLILSLSD